MCPPTKIGFSIVNLRIKDFEEKTRLKSSKGDRFTAIPDLQNNEESVLLQVENKQLSQWFLEIKFKVPR